jgi:hypothetical protein
MGYTQFTVEKVEYLIGLIKQKPHLVYEHDDRPRIIQMTSIKAIDLGSQNLYDQPLLPAPYASRLYEKHGINYTCIDLNGENGALQWDLSLPQSISDDDAFDLVVNAGTSEHIGTNGHFNIEATYNCFKTIHNLCKINRFIFNENPKTGNWPGHSFSYLSKKFYYQLVTYADYELMECGEVAAMGNDRDGWNVYAIIKKTGPRFPTLEQFKTFDLHQS